jgi:transcriptional regulator with XRE-family HTH domain
MSLSDREVQEFISLVGQKIKALRNNRNLTQDQLWDTSGIPQGTISRLERGLSEDIMLSTLLRLSDGLGVEVEELVKRDPDMAEDESQKDYMGAVAQLVGA